VEDIEIVIDSPLGDSVPTQVQEISKGTFKAEFCPRVAGEHQIYVSFGSDPVPGSPFPCKVYNVNAIKVRECKKGIVGKPVTFLVETSQAGPGNLEVTGKLRSAFSPSLFHFYSVRRSPNSRIKIILSADLLRMTTIDFYNKSLSFKCSLSNTICLFQTFKSRINRGQFRLKYQSNKGR
jgi:hypothetical protein